MQTDLQKIFTYPYDNNLLIRKQKSIRRELLARKCVGYIDKRIAILCGSTTDDIKNVLELFLLEAGIRPQFYQSEYNKYYEDAVFGNPEMEAFQPEIIVVFTSVVNILARPVLGDSNDAVRDKHDAEMKRFTQIWEKLTAQYPAAIIIQNNMELSYETGLGNLDVVESYGMTRFIEQLNRSFADYAAMHDNFYLHDLHGLAARIGLSKWHDRFQYYAYKLAMSYDVIPEVSLGLAKIIKGVLGKNKKCLVLDLDNTLWGGIIGDDGMENIEIGHETPTAEAYTAFQQYVLDLKERGVILAICSKNEEEVAKTGFDHPDSVLHVDDFVSFHANWEPKNRNIRAIAEEINIGTDSLVFIDDNPAERQIVRDTMPEVAVPEVDPVDVFSYIRALEGAGYFEPVAISEDDRKRNASYMENKQRKALAGAMESYDDFLQSLDMYAEIDAFQPIYFDRIAQLTNKSNQFNLTTRRYTRADIAQMAAEPQYITLYGRLTDKFGDNGLVSVVIGEKIGNVLHIRLWLMSCRVLKRGMEQMMLDVLVERAMADNCKELMGYYYKTAKNKMVAELYAKFGFEKVMQDGDNTVWKMNLEGYEKQGRFIALKEVSG
ncbi:HAD-IIIC family phosphatase [Selenomonas sp. CM52]|uniref:HAD-IIIC family phosphatase n=1 Tax=Selenomonas sp. CM52 TaxID=936381 RepID=UPI00027C3955|nr:HAD-IIIC family phosphatase [Selenomonas sp. CM52]EJU29862.1 FkbH domain protein [Selenomonas sp. CM52]